MPAAIALWLGWGFEGSGDLPRCLRRWWLCNRRVAGTGQSGRLPSIGVSLQPAIPRRVAPQQSPLPLHQLLTIVAQSRSGEATSSIQQSDGGDNMPRIDSL